MHKTIVKSATDILITIFEEEGWESSEEKASKLESALNNFMDKSSAITLDGEADLCYAVISRRILDNVRYGSKTHTTKLGKQIRQLENELYDVIMEIGMNEYIHQTPNFSIILSGESKVVTEEYGTVGMFARQNKVSKKYRVVKKKLYYSEGYGIPPHLVASVETDKSEKKTINKEKPDEVAETAEE